MNASVEQVAMAMLAGHMLHGAPRTSPGYNYEPRDSAICKRVKAEWPTLPPEYRAEWRTRARTYLRVIGRLK